MSDAPKRWDSVKGSITTVEVDLVGTTQKYREFRLSAHSPQHGWKSQVVRVEVDRLERHPFLYKYTLDLLAREIGIWGPQ